MHGQVALESDKTMLSLLDAGASEYNLGWNSSILKRALKSLIYEDLKLCNFERMVTTSLEVFESRFKPEDETDDKDNASEFYSMTLGQVTQKLVKSAGSKVRSKDLVMVGGLSAKLFEVSIHKQLHPAMFPFLITSMIL